MFVKNMYCADKVDVIGQKWLYSDKVFVFGQGGCIWVKVVVIGQRCL